MRRAKPNYESLKSLRIALIKQGRAESFQGFQQYVLKAEFIHEKHAFLSLFAFDGIRVSDFEFLIKSEPRIIDSDRVAISWRDHDQRTQRVILSPMTLKSLEHSNWSDIANMPINVLFDEYVPFGGRRDIRHQFKSDQLAWFAENCPGPVLLHLSGHVPMTALPDSAYARLLSSKVVINSSSNDVTDDQSEVISIALSGFLESREDDKNPGLIDELLRICHQDTGLGRPAHKKWMLEQCRTLAVKAVDYGPVTSLILSWVIDLFVNGSMSKKDLSGLTIGNYVSEASRLLFNELRGKDFSEWSDKDFSELYQKLIRGVSQGRQRNLASALTGWHRFLVNWFNFPPIASKLHNEVKMLPPHANVIWDHEYQLLQAWLSNAEMDQRLIMHLQVIFLIAFNIRIRTQELFRLKLCNFHIFDNQIEIRIYGTKTPAAKRVIIVNRHEFEKLEKLILRRYSEGASSKDFLFGDPNALKKIYRLRALYSYALQLVKLVAGDQTVRFHTFSHSVITRQLKPILKGGSGDENNPFYQIATDSAHFSINTTCSEYCHQYEFAVRESIDRALKNIKITSGLCSKWTGEISATLRQKKKRMLKHQCLDYWDVVFASTKLNTFVPITIGLSLGNVEKPIILNSKQAIGAYKLLQIFNDLAENFDKETTSIRQNVPISRIEDYLVVLRQVIQAGKLSSKIDYESTLDELVICLRQGIKGISFKKPIKTPAALILQAAKKMTNLNGLVIDAWLSSFRFGFLELKSTERIRQFIKLLHALDIPVTHLAIAVSVKLELMEIKKIQSHFYEYYGSTVPQYIVESRGGRPPCYLKVSSTQVLSNQVPASATSSVAWLNAIFLTSLVWAQERASHE